MGTPVNRPSRASRLAGAALILPLALLIGLSSPPARGASSIRIQVDGDTVALAEAGETVRDALARAHVRLSEDDEVTPAPDAPIPSDGLIRVQRVQYLEGAVEQKVPYRVIVRPATRGNRPYHPTVTGAGHNGLKRVTYRAKLVDGSEVERKTVSEEILREPVPQIVTARRPAALGSRGAYTGKRTLTVIATAYDPGPGSCGRYSDGRTCNGRRAGYGIIAVDPKVIPLGAKLFVPGYGFGIASDVGGAIKGNHIDLGYNSRSGSLQWGKRWVSVRIID